MRVELRQVGVRDEASIQGGIGPCGRAFCCCTFLKRFNSINVKMAKIQGLSLNPANISGACGRLKCCLGYEVEHYRELYDAAKARAKAEAAGGGRAPGGSGSEDNGADRCRDDRAAAGGAPDSDDSEGAPDAAAPDAAAPATASAASAPASPPGGAQG